MCRMVLAFGLALLGGAAIVGTAAADEQDEACMGDAVHFCADDIPDVARITACMERNKANLSPACARFFTDDPPSPKPQEPGKKAHKKKRAR